MYSQSHEAISSKHVVTCFENDANYPRYNLPIGITAIDITKNGAVTYHHYIQATGIHKELAAKTGESFDITPTKDDLERAYIKRST